MPCVIAAFEAPGGPEPRLPVRPAHLDDPDGKAAQIEAHGPRLAETDQPIGSTRMVDADDCAGAWTFAAGDPYRREGCSSASRSGRGGSAGCPGAG